MSSIVDQASASRSDSYNYHGGAMRVFSVE